MSEGNNTEQAVEEVAAEETPPMRRKYTRRQKVEEEVPDTTDADVLAHVILGLGQASSDAARDRIVGAAIAFYDLPPKDIVA